MLPIGNGIYGGSKNCRKCSFHQHFCLARHLIAEQHLMNVDFGQLILSDFLKILDLIDMNLFHNSLECLAIEFP
jgi:hypothetical protein